MKRDVLNLLTRERVVPLFRPFQLGTATIFMLHRFADSSCGNPGHSIDGLRANLDFLRRHRFRIVGLTELLDELDERRLPSDPAIAFTVDDGYGDFARVAAPVFADFDCPVTVFLTTAFIDGGFWMWYDKVAYLLAQSARTTLALEVGATRYRYSLDGEAARSRAASDLIERLKRVPEAVMQSTIETLQREAEVQLPSCIPAQYLPMSWSDVSRCARRGVTFGPHTITHPILSQVDDRRAFAEIEGSWQRVRAESPAAIPVFCYPNGDYGSFSDRERSMVTSIGMRATVLAEQHFTTSRHCRSRSSRGPTELPRFAYPDDAAQFRQIVCGMERVKQTLRRIVHA